MLPTPLQTAFAAAVSVLAVGDSAHTQNNGSNSMAVREVIDRNVALSPGAEVSLESIAGPVTIETGNSAAAQVHVVRGAATALDVQIGGTNAWTQAIDAAGQRGDAATVALLAGVGMQSLSWDYVAPEALFHIVAAMRAAGMVNYARMIAVEAVTRSA